MMKNKFSLLFWPLILLILTLSLVGKGWSDESKSPCTIMHPDRETLERWIRAYRSAPEVYIDGALKFNIPLKGSYSLLNHLKYTPLERNQGSCGNCWAWAGTGVMEIALNVEEGIYDRLSVQYLNSCKGTGGNYACCGGWLEDLALFYTINNQAIPWGNMNASWQDGGRTCNDGSSMVSCPSVSTSPSYAVSFVNEEKINTFGVGQAAAIANIKNILHQNKAVWFAYFLATDNDWNNFRNFWNNQHEDVTWNPDLSCGHMWDEYGGGGHAVLCVGYNDDDPSNSYWIMVNSWGTAGGGRPNGIFRLDMDMDYDCTFSYWGMPTQGLYWQTLDIDYVAQTAPCACDLNHDSRCDMQDWLMFGADWGRTDCSPGNPCECDLNQDGRCDMQDWLLFGVDWGRTDCSH